MTDTLTLFPVPPPDEPEEPPPTLAELVETLVEEFGFDDVRREVARHSPVTSVPSAPARSTDPETSHAAAKAERDVSRFSARSRQARLLAVFAGGQFTDQQATVRVIGASAAPSAFDGCRRRCSDLRAAGYLYDTGLRRTNTASNDESVVWGITLAGMQAMSLLDATGWSR